MSLSHVKSASESSSHPPSPSTGVPLAALIGNPNTGKTSVFNMLTGGRHRVSNYPGTTVEKRIGRIRRADHPIDIIDLPGTYSLAARSPDEMLVADVLTGRRNDVDEVRVVVIVVDASNLVRNMFLATQILELDVPVVIALNMTDVARRRGIRLNLKRLRSEVGAPVVPISARSGLGRARLTRAIGSALDSAAPPPVIQWPEAMEDAVSRLTSRIRSDGENPNRLRTEIRRCLIDVGGYSEKRLTDRPLRDRSNGDLTAELAEHRRALAQRNVQLPEIDARLRYDWIEANIAPCVTPRDSAAEQTGLADRILTHRVAGSLILAAVMTGVFCAVFSWAAPLMDLIDGLFASLAGAITAALPDGVLASFLADGVVAGVGGTLIFLPQILILSAMIAVLEDSGYLARVALLADRLFRPAGLSGHSLVPLLSSFACAVPGILSARTVADPRERLVTILIAPLMSCSARIPVYVLMVAAFVPRRTVLGFLPLQGLVFTSMYVLGAVVAMLVAIILKKTILRGEEGTFFLELPDYRWPSLRSVATRLWDQGRVFVVSAGTIILASSIVIWALSYFPRPSGLKADVRQKQIAAGVTDETAIENAVDGAYLSQSALGRVGQAIEPAVKPLGWDWRLGVATLAAFPAREVFIANLGVIYNLGEESESQSSVLRDALRGARWPDGRLVFSIPVALSVMVFFALCCQCQATVATIKRETNSWRWPIFAFGYMTTLAYIASMIVYQVGSRIG